MVDSVPFIRADRKKAMYVGFVAVMELGRNKLTFASLLPELSIYSELVLLASSFKQNFRILNSQVIFL